MHNPHLEKYPALGLHLLLWGFIWVLSRPLCVHVCMCVGGGNERHGVLSNSPPHLMAQLHYYLAHTLGPSRLGETSLARWVLGGVTGTLHTQPTQSRIERSGGGGGWGRAYF